MKRAALWITLLICAVNAAAQINPVTQFNWGATTGSGAPTAYCPVIVTGTTVNGSAVITGLSSTSGLLLYQRVVGAGIPTGAYVVALNVGASTATLSAAATVDGTAVALNFLAYGMPYTDITSGDQYVCSSGGWKLTSVNPLLYPGVGVVTSTGSGWGASLVAPTGLLVGTTDVQTLSNKTVDGVTPTTFGYLDPTSSVQTQLNAKMQTFTYAGTGAPTATCSSTVNNGWIAVNQTPVAYQCTNATGTYSWNGLTILSHTSSTIVCGPGAGTAPSVCAIAGNDCGGQITITTGSSPVNAGLIATITLGTSRSSSVYAVLRSSNAAASSLGGNSHDYPDNFTNNSWTITANVTGLSASTTYTWSYLTNCN